MVGTYWYNYVTNKTQAGPPEGVLDQEEQVDLSTLLIYQSPACSTNLLTICCCCAEMARPAAAAAARQHREEDNGWWSWCVFHAFLERLSRVFGASFTHGFVPKLMYLTGGGGDGGQKSSGGLKINPIFNTKQSAFAMHHSSF